MEQARISHLKCGVFEAIIDNSLKKRSRNLASRTLEQWREVAHDPPEDKTRRFRQSPEL